MIECVEEFQYLGSLIMSNERIDAEEDKCIGSASRAFGALHRAVFRDRNLTIKTKLTIYNPCVLSVLYRSECWTSLHRHLKRPNTFHHWCIPTVLGITNRRHWMQHITPETVREKWDDYETVATKITRQRLEWLGHACCPKA